MVQEQGQSKPLGAVRPDWGSLANDHFGYSSDEERKAKRGLEDWELVDKIPESQRAVPYWFYAIIVVVLLVALGLAFPFWGSRPGQVRNWLDWGFAVAIVYLCVAGYFIHFMVRMYGSARAGRLDSDAEASGKATGASSKPNKEQEHPE